MKRPWSGTVISGALAVVAILFGAWCAWTNQDGQGERFPPVIIYLVDTLRADRLGAYGYGLSTSPSIDSIAADSVVFEQVYAPAPWTVPSVASLITSTFVCEHGLFSERHRLDENRATLPQRLANLGYLALGRTQNPIVGPMTGLDRGFHEFEERDEPFSDMGKAMDDLLARVWHGEPLYLYIHTNEPHDPYQTPREFQNLFGHVSVDEVKAYRQAYQSYRRASTEDWGRRQPLGTVDNSIDQAAYATELSSLSAAINQLYDASVRFADSNFSDVVGRLKNIGLWDKAIFVFLSDHGEEFGEHGGWFHEQSAYEELIRVPLFIHFPDGKYAGKRIAEPISLLDVMPTILDYIGQSSSCSDCRGRSLIPLITHGPKSNNYENTVFSVREDLRLFHKQWSGTRGNRNVVSRAGDKKHIWNVDSDTLESYDLKSDPAETHNVANQRGPAIAEIRDEMKVWWDACNASGDRFLAPENLDQDQIDKLRALGYL